jgi:hypothetical protein
MAEGDRLEEELLLILLVALDHIMDEPEEELDGIMDELEGALDIVDVSADIADVLDGIMDVLCESVAEPTQMLVEDHPRYTIDQRKVGKWFLKLDRVKQLSENKGNNVLLFVFIGADVYNEGGVPPESP